MRYKITAWGEYQHYKDRCPPWIKLHHSLLTSKIWIMGNDATRSLLIASMLLAARDKANDGSFDGDPEYIKKFAYLNTKPDFNQLIEYGFIELVHDASKVLADCNTEKRREETETETETEGGKRWFTCIDKKLLADWLEVRKAKRAGKLTETAFKGLQREAKKAGITDEQAVKICCERGWQSFKAEWMESKSKPNGNDPAWWSSNALIETKGRELGIYAKPGESMIDYKGRIQKTINNSSQ